MGTAKTHTALVITHVPFEGPGAIAAWIKHQSLNLQLCPWYEQPEVYPPERYGAIIIMGGPMNVHETEKYPWLVSETRFLERAVKASVPLLGICFGAQLLALLLGARVTRNAFKEIGWFPLQTHPAAQQSRLFQMFPESFMAMHWHGDTFSLPPRAIPLASSQACENQGFVLDERIVGLQFHLEFEESGLNHIIDACRHELQPEPFVQSEQAILSQSHLLDQQHWLLFQCLDRWFLQE